MIYSRLKDFMLSAKNSDSDTVFDLIPECVKSKIIYTVGRGATNTAAYLSSVMRECGIAHSRAICSPYIEPKNRFLLRGKPVSLKKLTVCADKYAKQLNKLSADALYLLLALDMLDIENQFLIVETSRALYENTLLKLPIAPEAVVFCDTDGISVAPALSREVIALTDENDFDYISSKTDTSGARKSLISPNKIEILKATPLGTRFYYNSIPYKIKSIDERAVPLACLAVECAKLSLGATRLEAARGIENASPELDPVLYSLSPTVFLKLGDADIKLPRSKNYTAVTEESYFPEYQTDGDAVFCGSKDFLELIKKNMSSSKKNRQLSR